MDPIQAEKPLTDRFFLIRRSIFGSSSSLASWAFDELSRAVLQSCVFSHLSFQLSKFQLFSLVLFFSALSRFSRFIPLLVPTAKHAKQREIM